MSLENKAESVIWVENIHEWKSQGLDFIRKYVHPSHLHDWIECQVNIPGYLHLQVIQVIQKVEYLLDSANFLGFITRGYDIRMWMWHVRSNYLWSAHGKGQLLSWFSSSGYIKCRISKGRGDITCDTWNESTWYGKGLESSAGWSLDQLEPFQEVSNNKQTPGYFFYECPTKTTR